MKRIAILLIALGGLTATSCRKHSCTCATDVYDSNGYWVNTTYETHTVRGMTTLKAISECDELEYTNNTYCNLD